MSNRYLVAKHLQESLSSFMGKEVTTETKRQMLLIVQEVLDAFAEEDIIDAAKWEDEKELSLIEIDGYVSIILPDWLIEWMNEED